MKPRKCVYGFLALKSKGLVVGINTDPPTRDRKTKVARFIARHQIKFPILLDYFQTLKQYRVEQIPYTVLIDRQGKIFLEGN